MNHIPHPLASLAAPISQTSSRAARPGSGSWQSIGRPTLALVAVAAAAFLVQPGAHAQSGPSGSMTDAGAAGTTQRAPASAPAARSTAMKGESKMSRADAGMLRDIAQANMAEVETGKLALEKSQNDGVRKFAQMVVDHHTQGLQKTRTLAQAQGVDLPDSPSVAQKARATELKALSAERFDARFAKDAGVKDHESTLKLLKKTQSSAKSAELKALAAEMVPVVTTHLEHARALMKSTQTAQAQKKKAS